ncbi:MAG: hypothetical protein ACRDRV_17955 [Pseudonocardiaceae bacterium]
MVLGLLADPEAPAELAREFADQLPGLLSEQRGGWSWDVRVLVERLPLVDDDYRDLLTVARERRRQQQWDYVICLTDSPLHVNGNPVAADVIGDERTAVVSLPAFGGVLLRQRLREILVEIVADLISENREPARGDGPGGDEQGDDGRGEHGQRRALPGLPGEFQRVTPRDEHVDVRILATRSKVRLLLGMVWANQPWRLVFGLARALAAALAAGAYVLVTPTIWQLADSLGTFRLLVSMVFSIAAMAGWLILDHNLWVRRSEEIPREQASLYNASTVVTLVLGVLCAYAGLFTASLLAEAFLIDEDFFQSRLGHPVGWLDYVEVAWFSASLSVLAGAFGSGFDSEESARQAAYGARERERRAVLEDSMSEQRTT